MLQRAWEAGKGLGQEGLDLGTEVVIQGPGSSDHNADRQTAEYVFRPVPETCQFLKRTKINSDNSLSLKNVAAEDPGVGSTYVGPEAS